ncbi:MAG: Ig-like domain-containing protein [Neomegalonema sp.]|nr:Ig-like domain-containing protein [Neomegalonema sp.]
MSSSSSLTAGAIAFIGYNSDDAGYGDGFGFVALTDIAAGEQICFTDNGVQGGVLGDTEDTLIWTSGGVVAGDVIRIERSGTVSNGSVTGDLNFSTGGDQVLAYVGDTATPTFLAALDMSGGFGVDTNATAGTELPTGLIEGTTALAITPETDNAYYTGPAAFANAAQALAAINNPSNWTLNDDAAVRILGNWPLAFAIDPLAVPEITIIGADGSSEILTGDDTPSLVDGTDFGTAAAGGRITRTFTIRNDALAQLSVADIEIEGLNAADFSVSGFTSGTITGQSSQTFSVTYDPNAEGVSTATIVVRNSDPDETDYTFDITGISDETAPVLTTSTPDDGASGVVVGADITLTFSEEVQAGSGVITIETSTGAVLAQIDVAAVDGTITFSGNQIILNPVEDLPAGTEIRVSIGAGAITDLGGTALDTSGSGGEISFVTERGTPTAVIIVSGQSLVANWFQDADSEADDVVTTLSVAQLETLTGFELSARIASGDISVTDNGDGTVTLDNVLAADRFAIRYFEQHGGQYGDVIIVDAASGGKPMLEQSNEDQPSFFDEFQSGALEAVGDGNGDFDGPMLSDTVKPAIDDALAGRTNLELVGLVWAQGEADTTLLQTNADLTTEDEELEALYAAGLNYTTNEILNYTLNSFPGAFQGQASEPLIYIQHIGRRLGSFEGLDDVKDIQNAFAAANDNVVLATEIYDIELTDTVHLTAEGFHIAADRMAAAITSGNTGPVVTNVTMQNSFTDATVTFDVDVPAGMTLTLGDDAKDLLFVRDEGVLSNVGPRVEEQFIPVTSVAINGNQIVFTLSRPMVGDGVLSYGYSAATADDINDLLGDGDDNVEPIYAQSGDLQLPLFGFQQSFIDLDYLPRDVIAPVLVSSLPSDDSTFASTTDDIVLTFDEKVVAGTGSIRLFNAADDSEVSASVLFEDYTVRITPDSDLDVGASYYVQVEVDAVRDRAGNIYLGFEDTTTLNFTTSASAAELGAGSIAFVAYGGDDALALDGFAFVATQDILAGTVINFTDRGWNGTGFNAIEASEDVLQWTSPGIAAGTVVTMQRTTGGHFASVGTTSGEVLNLSTSGDQILAFTGEEATPTFLAAIDMNGGFGLESDTSSGTELPPGLVEGRSAIAIAPEVDNGFYNGPVVFESLELAQVMINDPANWITSDTDIAQSSWQTVTYDIGAPDTIVPTLLSTAPVDDTIGVEPGASITLTFSEEVYQGTGAIALFSRLGDAEIPSTVSFDGATVTITPNSALPAGAEYYVTVAADAVVDVANNPFAGILDTTALSFFTENQLGLSTGSIAFIGYNADDMFGAGNGSDAFAFVATTDIEAGQQIHFTENGYFNGALGTSEPTLTWTSSGLTIGDVVIIERTAFGASASSGSVSGDDLNFSANGDQVLAYQGSSSAPTFLAALDMSGGFGADSHPSYGTQLPDGLTEGFTAVSVTPEVDNAYYSGTTDFLSPTEALTAINDPANWTSQNDPLIDPAIWAQAFSIVAPPPGPELTVLGLGNDITDGDATPDLLDGTDFGTLPGIGESAIQQFVIRNDGTTDLTLTDLSVTGVNADEFVATGFVPGLLLPGTSQVITVTFTPTAEGLRSASIEITSDDADEALFDFAVQGAIDLTGPVLVSSTPADEASDIGIADPLSLTFDEAVAVGTGFVTIRSSADDSVVEQIDITSDRISVADTTVTIDPVGNLGLLSGYYLEVDAGAITDLQGNGFAGITGPDALNFTTGVGVGGPLFQESFETDGEGTRYVNSNTQANLINDYFTRTDGSDIKTRNSDGYQGIDGSYFFAMEDTDGLSSDDLETLTFTSVDTAGQGEMTFTGAFGIGNTAGTGASAYDDRDFVAVLYSTDGGSTYQVGMVFRAVSNSGDLANEPLGLVTDLQLTTSSSAAAEELRGAVTSGDADIRDVMDGTGDPAFTLSNTLQEFSFTIPEADSVQIIVAAHLDGGNEEFAMDNLRIESNGPVIPEPEIAVAGLDDTLILDGDVTPDTVDGTDFGATGLAAPSSRTFTISNDGTAPLSVTAINITGADAAAFTLVGFTPASVPVGGSLDVQIDFAPTVTGLHEASVEIVSNDADEASFDFAIQGTGDVTAPVLTATNPVDDAVDVAFNQNITLTFDEEVIAAGDGFIYIHAADGTVIEALRATSGNVVFSGNTVTVNPVNDLDFDTDYYVTIDANAIGDAAGNIFAGISDPTALNFTTGSLPVGPLFEETFETDGLGTRYFATASFTDFDDDYFVRTDGTDIDTKNNDGYQGFEGSFFWAGEDLDGANPTDLESLTFAQIDTAGAGTLTFTGSFGVGNTGGVGASAYDDRDYLAVMYSTDGGTTWQVGLVFRSIDGSGNQPLALVSNPSFITSEAEAADGIRDAAGAGDTDIRDYISNFGDAGQTLSNTMQDFSFTFEAGDTLDIMITAHMDGGDEEFAFDNLRVDAGGSSDLATQTPEPTILPTALDETAPELTDASPADDSTDVAADANIVLSFDEDVAAGTGSVILRRSSDNAAVETIDAASAQVSISGSSVTINPSADLAAGTDFYLEIENGAFTDLSGNAFAGITGSAALNFSTAEEAVTPEPTAIVTPTTVTTTTSTADLPEVPSIDTSAAISGLVGSDNSDDIIIGTDGAEKLDGKSGNDSLFAGAGDDVMRGRDGDDLLVGGAGNDQIEGDDGADMLFGEAGDDKLRGREGDDILRGGDGADRLYGDGGNDTIIFGAGADEVEGGAGADRFVYEPGGNASQIADFNTAEGDVLDLSAAIDGTGAASSFVRLVQSGSQTSVLINADGQGDDFVEAFSFEGDAVGKDLTTLINDEDLLL